MWAKLEERDVNVMPTDAMAQLRFVRNVEVPRQMALTLVGRTPYQRGA